MVSHALIELSANFLCDFGVQLSVGTLLIQVSYSCNLCDLAPGFRVLYKARQALIFSIFVISIRGLVLHLGCIFKLGRVLILAISVL